MKPTPSRVRQRKSLLVDTSWTNEPEPNKPMKPTPHELASIAAHFVTDEESIPRAVSLAVRLLDACKFAVHTGGEFSCAYQSDYQGLTAVWESRNRANAEAEAAASELPKWNPRWDGEADGKELFKLQAREIRDKGDCEDRVFTLLEKRHGTDKARKIFTRYRDNGMTREEFAALAMDDARATIASRSDAGRLSQENRKEKSPPSKKTL